MNPEQRVAAYLADCYQRRLRWKQLQEAGKGFMHGWGQVEQLGREIEAAHWVPGQDWPGASSCGWGSDDEKEPEYARLYETVGIGDGIAEVVVECRHETKIKDKTVYRVRCEEGDWRIEKEFEIGWGPQFRSHCENPEVKSIRTVPRSLHLERLCPSANGLMKPAIRLHVVRDGTVTTFDSHMAGPFLANDPTTWPRCECHNTPLLGGLQLWKRDLAVRPCEIQGELFTDSANSPRDVVGTKFPTDTDVLQVFWCPFYHPYERSAHHLRWLNSSGLKAAQAANPAFRQPPAFEGMVPMPCRLYSEWYPDYPALWEARQEDWWNSFGKAVQAETTFGTQRTNDPEQCTSGESVNEFYSDKVGAIGGTKWGGYPAWIQDPQVPICECGTPMQHLVTVASSCDPTVGRFPVTVESKLPVRWDEELCMGDVGSVYYFLCPICPGGTRYEAVFQCS